MMAQDAVRTIAILGLQALLADNRTCSIIRR